MSFVIVFFHKACLFERFIYLTLWYYAISLTLLVVLTLSTGGERRGVYKSLHTDNRTVISWLQSNFSFGPPHIHTLLSLPQSGFSKLEQNSLSLEKVLWFQSLIVLLSVLYPEAFLKREMFSFWLLRVVRLLTQSRGINWLGHGIFKGVTGKQYKKPPKLYRPLF